ncbi:uncharacterized protein IAS62_004639 [Cryptococcus decagattii]|uniref:Uncharacterized protein n=1 Tax=Cryptococcus decagattii TaxID=1859122 RepID=A0ABZ2AXX9_9TREE
MVESVKHMRQEYPWKQEMMGSDELSHLMAHQKLNEDYCAVKLKMQAGKQLIVQISGAAWQLHGSFGRPR